MSYQIPKDSKEMLSKNVKDLLKQDVSLLRQATKQILSSDNKVVFSDFVGPVEAKEATGDMIYSNIPHSRRRIRTDPYYYAELIDYEDRARTIRDCDGYYAQASSMALKRSMDRVIMNAIFGTALFAGKEGREVISFPSTQVVPVDFQLGGGGSASGISVEKIRKATQMLEEADVTEREKKYLILSPYQKSELLVDPKVTFVDGQVEKFLGVKLITYNRVPTDSNGYRRCALVTENTIHFALKDEIRVEIDNLLEKKNSTQVYVVADFGATRMSEKHVVEIKCLET